MGWISWMGSLYMDKKGGIFHQGAAMTAMSGLFGGALLFIMQFYQWISRVDQADATNEGEAEFAKVEYPDTSVGKNEKSTHNQEVRHAFVMPLEIVMTSLLTSAWV